MAFHTNFTWQISDEQGQISILHAPKKKNKQNFKTEIYSNEIYP